MEIGKQLKNARMHSGLTQENVAEKIHVSRQTISNWENDMGEPPYETLKMKNRTRTLSTLLN